MKELFDAVLWDRDGGAIEKESFRRIDAEADPAVRARFSEREWHVARRLVHTCADFTILDHLEFSGNPVEAALAALRRGARIYSDSNMIKSGLSVPKLKRFFSGYMGELYAGLEEAARRKRLAERRRQEEAERRRLAAEERQRKREEELKRMQEELKRKRKEERRKRKEEQRRKQEAIEKARLAMEEQRRKREEEERRRQEEEERRRQEEEERRRREEEERRRLAAEWDEDFNVNFDDFDALSNGTSAWSVFMDGEKFNKKIRKQLNFDAVPGFAEMFDDMDMNARRRLGRVARLQAVQKKKWLSDVWRLFDPNFSPEALWMTLKAFANDDGTALNGLLASAKRIANRFMRFSSCGSVSIHMRAMITGPHFGGKTTFLRAVFLYILNTLVNTGGFKNVLIIPMDARDQKKELKTREGFYAFVSNAVIRALLAERPDLQLFSNSLQKAFSQLLVAPKVRRLPKPISSQDYLRRPMKMVDSLLTGLHKLYHDPKGHKMFLEEVATLPKTIGDIFGFPASIVVFDHVDEADVTCNNLHLFEFMKRGLAKTQFMLSGTECERVYDMLEDLYPKPIVGFKPMTSIINITDVCQSQNEDRVIEITFENKEVPSIWMDSNYCGGCPTFVSRFDDICKCLSDYSEMPENQKRKETMIVAVTKMEILLDLVMSFGKYQDQDGGPPRVKYLDMIFKDELKERQEAVREACKAAREQQKQQARDVNATEDVPDGYVEEKQPDDVVEESVDADDEGSGTDEDPQQGVESEGDGNEPGNEEEANAEEEPVQEEAPIQDDVKHSEEEEPVQGEAPIRDDVKHSEEEEPVQEEVPVQDDVKHSEKEEPVEEEVPIQDDVKHSEEEEPVREEAPIEEDDRTPDGVEHSEEEELVQEQAPIEEEQIQDHLKQLDEEEESVHEEVPIEEENIPDDVKQPEEEDTLLEEEPAGGDQGVHAALEPLDDEDASIGEEDLTDDGEGLPDDLQLSDDEEDFVPE